MDNLFALLVLASLVLLIIGIFKPATSLFWYKQQRTKKRSAMIYGALLVVSFILFGVTTDNTSKAKIASATPTKNAKEDNNETQKIIETENKIEVSKSNTSKYLFESADDFKNTYNDYCSKSNLDFNIDELKIQEGEVQNTFQYMFNDNLGLLGTVDKQTNAIKEILMLGTGDGSLKSGSNIILCMLSIIATVDPTILPDERVGVLKELGFLGNKEVDLKNLSSNTKRNGIKYFVNSSEITGLMFGASKS